MKTMPFYLMMIFIMTGCSNSGLDNFISFDNKLMDKKTKTIALQPIEDFKPEELNYLVNNMEKLYNVCVLPKIKMPLNSYYTPNHRYRADTIINNLKSSVGKDTIVVGLTHYDISSTKGKYKDYGIIGLGFMSGNACVISTKRLKKSNRKEQLFKVVLHEIGHNVGLPHCPVKTCLMRDAKGGNPIDEEKEFCHKCINKMDVVCN